MHKTYTEEKNGPISIITVNINEINFLITSPIEDCMKK
jgi:hypothetical protein